MTKAELIAAVANRAGTSQVEAEKVLTAFFAEVTAAAKKGGDVAWPGFGKFSTTKRAARTVANPQDRSKTVKVPASTAMKFTASSVLRAELNPKRKK